MNEWRIPMENLGTLDSDMDRLAIILHGISEVLTRVPESENWVGDFVVRVEVP